MPILSPGDDLEKAVMKLSNGDQAAARILIDVVARCSAIDPTCDHPFMVIIQLDNVKVRGSHIATLFEKVCGSDLVRFLAVLCWARMGKIPPSNLRANVSLHRGHTPPPWFKPIDAAAVLAKVQAYHPDFGKTA